MATIAEKVYGLLHNEYGPIDALGATDDRPLANPDDHIEGEEYVLAFGLAYALARAEEPFASDDELAERARSAATDAHRWMGTVGGKEAAKVTV